MSENQLSSQTSSNSTLTASDTVSVLDNHIYDVVVVGAGPVGLAIANGLRQRGIDNIIVLDQTRAFRQIGQTIDLLPNGLTSLRYIDHNAYKAVKNSSINFSNSRPDNEHPRWNLRNCNGDIIRSISTNFEEWFQEYGEGRVSISWYNLQTALRNLLPESKVKANHRCINVTDEPENNCVRVDCISNTTIGENPYAHWEETKSANLEPNEQQSNTKFFRGKLIVGADGINSTVRQIIYKNSRHESFAKPEYSGFAAIFCPRVIDIPEEMQAEIEAKFLQGSPVTTIFHNEISDNSDDDIQDIRIILASRTKGQYFYIIHLPIALDKLVNRSGNSLIELALEVLAAAKFPDALQQLVRLSPPENIDKRPYYLHRVRENGTNDAQIQPSWSAERVVLVGDAAHGMPPFMAQGANQGLEDAIAIVTLIAKIAKKNQWDDSQAISTAFDKYESLRRPIMAYVQEATLRRLPYASDKDWQEYNERVYRRNFDELIEILSA